MTNLAQGVDYSSLALLPPLPRLPGPLDPTLGKGLETESPNPPTQQRLQLQRRKEAPACSVPRRIWLGTGCSCGSAGLSPRTPCPWAAGEPAGARRDARSPRSPSGECHSLREGTLASERLSQSDFAPMPGHFNGVWKLQRSAGPGKGGSGCTRMVARGGIAGLSFLGSLPA